ncbi:MAG TPA: DUF2243 domain-containing protein [Gaiellales bacterium]|jgi:hypothetical protein|nr:DUF2243 domain-containing protein [Gaiellales bacterium]
MTTQFSQPRDPVIRLSARAIFAASALILAGAFHLVNGYVLLQHKSYLETHNVIYHNLSFWGWAFVAWGIIAIVGGVMLLARSVTGAAIAVAIASIAAFMWFLMIFAAPFAAVVGVAVNMLVIWAITSGVEQDLGP